MKHKLVLGFSNNIDYEITWNSAIMEKMAMDYQISQDELRVDIEITDERSLLVSILSFLQYGKGGERFVSSLSIIEKFVHRFENKITHGGTSIRAAIAVEKLGYHCALHFITMNEHVRRLTPPECDYVCSCKEEKIYPHLIVQYQSKTCINTPILNVCSPQDNRIIYHKNPGNTLMEINEDFSKFCPDAKVFLITGFNAMQDENLLQKRLESVKRIMQKLSEKAIVYYEDGGLYNYRLRKVTRHILENKIDIHGMNEDELQTYYGKKLNLLDASEMANAIKKVLTIIGTRTILVHTRFWAMVYGQNATLLRDALDGGITLAATRCRFGDDFTLSQYETTAASPRMIDGLMFAQEIEILLGDKACCLPSVCITETSVTTIGLGDAFVGGFLSRLSDSKILFNADK